MNNNDDKDVKDDEKDVEKIIKNVYGRCKKPLYDTKWILYSTTLKK